VDSVSDSRRPSLAFDKAFNRLLVHSQHENAKERRMLRWALIFLVLAIVAGIFGFSGVAGAATNIAWILAVVFLIIFVVGLIMGRDRV